MPRKVTTGRVGRPILGDLVSQDNALKSVVSGDNIILDPNNGNVEVTSHVEIADDKQARFSDGASYVSLEAPAAVTSGPLNLVLPAADGTNGQVLQTNGSGALSFTTQQLAVSNRTTSDSNTYYLAMVDATSLSGGQEDTLAVSDSNRLQFTPNPGRLTVNEIRIVGSTASSSTSSGAAQVTGGLGVGGQLTAQTIVESSSIALKENINPIADALDTITKLKGVTYDRTDNKEHEAGLIAEWVDEVIPELVSKDKEGNATGIKYSKLTAYLIEAVKILKDEVDSLKKL